MASDALVHRINRIQGQLEALKRMVTSGEADCVKTIELTKAASNAMKKFAQAYVEAHLDQCVDEKRAMKDMHIELKKVVHSSFSLS